MTDRCCHALPAHRGELRTCGRCNWTPTGDETLADHADAAEHPLCCCCGRSLPSDRGRTCRDCQDRCGAHFNEVLAMWDELPDLLSNHAARDLPGGDVLVLLGGGGTGNVSRFGDDYEPDPLRSPERWWLLGAIGPLELQDYQAAERARYGKEHVVDNMPGKPPRRPGRTDRSTSTWRRADIASIPGTLIPWADGWRDIRGEQTPRTHDGLPHSVTGQLAADYLLDHQAWAAENHWAWADWAEEVAHLRRILLRVTGRSRAPRRLGLDCFDCGGPLEHRIVPDDAAPPAPEQPRWWVATDVPGPVDLATYNQRAAPGAGLEEEDATCRTCDRRYTPAMLLLSQRAAVEDAQWLEDPDGTTWGTVRAIAAEVDRAAGTLRGWHRAGLVRGQRHGGELYLHTDDVKLLAPRWTTDEDGTVWGTGDALAQHLHRPWSTLRSWYRQELVRGRYIEGGTLVLSLADAQREHTKRPTRRHTAEAS